MYVPYVVLNVDFWLKRSHRTCCTTKHGVREFSGRRGLLMYTKRTEKKKKHWKHYNKHSYDPSASFIILHTLNTLAYPFPPSIISSLDRESCRLGTGMRQSPRHHQPLLVISPLSLERLKAGICCTLDYKCQQYI